MPFIRKFTTLLNGSGNYIYKIDSLNGINVSLFDKNFNFIAKKNFVHGDFDFLDYWFDMNSNGKIYGVINSKDGRVMHVNIKDKKIIKNTLIKYNTYKHMLKFLYINKNFNAEHIIYYSLSRQKAGTAKLIHHYNNGRKWKSQVIDTLKYNVLTNFVVTYDENYNPVIFYYKLVNGSEELFASGFNSHSEKWNSPIQITNSGKSKLYLSVIYSTVSGYHIAYSENTSSRYKCIYIHGNFDDSGFFKPVHNWILGDTVACSFPAVNENNGKIYVNWIEYNLLNQRISKDNGATWSIVQEPETAQEEMFICCNYHEKNINQGRRGLNSQIYYMIDNSKTILSIK